jgi:LysM repeat protein
MNEPSPLVPQGSFEAQARGKSRVKFAFYTIVVIHVLAIAGFLIIGCKREDKDAAANPTPTNDMATPAFGSDPNLAAPSTANTNAPGVAATTNAVATNIPGANTGVAVTPFAPTTPASPVTPATATVVDSTATAAATEHTIVKGDTFATLATHYHVSVKDIQAANPNLNPTKLKIGDKVKIPAKTATASSGSSTTPASDSGTYKVKSGDTLSKIATVHKTSVKELQRLNNLTTTQIRVGQVLKLPQAAAAPLGSPQPPPAQ